MEVSSCSSEISLYGTGHCSNGTHTETDDQPPTVFKIHDCVVSLSASSISVGEQKIGLKPAHADNTQSISTEIVVDAQCNSIKSDVNFESQQSMLESSHNHSEIEIGSVIYDSKPQLTPAKNPELQVRPQPLLTPLPNTDRSSPCQNCGQMSPVGCNADVCSVCLSPLRCAIKPTPDDKKMVETKCKHFFHKQCFVATMMVKCQCPVCRSQLSPVEQLQSLFPDLHLLRVHQMRTSVVEAANRGRNAVRMAMLRRQQQQQPASVVMPEQQPLQRALFNDQ